jgi:hypothetical protein
MVFIKQFLINILSNCLSAKPKKRLGVPNTQKMLKCVSEILNPPLQSRKHQKDTLVMNPPCTSTPNTIRCREIDEAFTLISPILQSDQKGQRGKVINNTTENKRNSVCGSTSLSRSVVCIYDASKNISPEVNQCDPSFKGSNMSNELLPSSVVEESVSKRLCKYAVNKEKSCHVSAGAVLQDSVMLIGRVSSQLQSYKLDEKIVSSIGSSNDFVGPDCELKKSKESSTCKDQKFDAATQSCINDSLSADFVIGSHQNLPVQSCADVGVRRQQNRWTKYVGRRLCRSDDSCAEEFLDFSDVPLEQHISVGPITEGFLGFSNVSAEQHSCDYTTTGGSMNLSDVPTEHDLCKDPVTGVVPPDLHIFRGASNKCAESKGVNIAANIPSSESRNMSVILFDSWDSGNGVKIEGNSERLSENREAVIFDGSQMSSSRVQNNHSENSRTDVSKHLHSHKSSVVVDESDCKYPRDKSELLCSSISKEHLLQEPSDMSIGAGESHTEGGRIFFPKHILLWVEIHLYSK